MHAMITEFLVKLFIILKHWCDSS